MSDFFAFPSSIFDSQTATFGQKWAVDFGPVADTLGLITYILLFIVALWGAYCCIVLWRRIGYLSFRNEDEQDAYLNEVERLTGAGQDAELQELCEGDPRGIPMLTMLAQRNRRLSIPRLRTYLIERFQRDILSELDYRMTWVQTIIKAAPMLGLFGTVIGMMGAFGKLSSATEVSPDKLAADIMLALITTACGMTIAIPLILATASITNRIGKLEDLIGSGLTRLLEIFGGKQHTPPSS